MNFKEWIKNENLYGVYCGPGPKLSGSCDSLANGSPMPRPIDRLDGACQNHDVDYCNAGATWQSAMPFGRSNNPQTREADKKLLANVRRIAKTDNLSPKAQRFAKLIRKYFSYLIRGKREHFDFEQELIKEGGKGSGPKISMIATGIYKPAKPHFKLSKKTIFNNHK